MNADAQLIIWDTISMAWTEIGLDDDDYPRIADQLLSQAVSWEEIQEISIRDVCGSFAFDTFLIVPCMLWMIMPDWGYNQDYLRKRIHKWNSKPIWVHFLNPLRILGYPLAILMSRGVRSRLKVAYNNALHRA
jgi:hypothetical protein